MKLNCLLAVAGINIRHHFKSHFLLALIIAFLTPVIFGISSLNAEGSAQPLEMFLSLTGLILLTPVFYPEQDENIRDLIRSKRTEHLEVCFVRLLYSLSALAAIYGIFIIFMYCSEDKVTFRHFIGGYSSALFLGTLGFFFAGVCENTAAGYMVGMIFYISNFALKKELKNLYLFSMSSGSFHEKYSLMSVSVILIFFTFLLINFRYSSAFSPAHRHKNKK